MSQTPTRCPCCGAKPEHPHDSDCALVAYIEKVKVVKTREGILWPSIHQVHVTGDLTIEGQPSRATLNEPGYELLADALQRAYDQAARGKGKERHAQGEPFHLQVMQDGARRFGIGSLLFQAFKKSEESQRLPTDRAVNELLGSIVYLAGAVIAREREEVERQARLAE